MCLTLTLSLIPVSPRRVVMLEKKAEESFGFEIQVGVEPCPAPHPSSPHLALHPGYF